MIAYQTAVGIETHLSMIAKDLSFKAERNPIKYFKQTEDLDFVNKKYIETNDGVIKAVTRTDSNANIIYTYPYSKDAIGKNILYQAHMKKLLSNHEPVISDVFQAVQGYEAIAVHYPVIIDGRYDGSLAYLISFTELSNIYLHQFSDDEKDITRLILSSEGVILNSCNSETRGKNINGMLEKDAILYSGIAKILSEEENDLSYVYKSKKKVGFYIKINLPFGNYWKILYSIDESSIMSEMHDFIIKTILLLIFLIAGTFYTTHKIFSFNKL
ncbi:MAG: cache domain-containing protein, partial [Candidatus Delongbacteria bacterium]|nr:cache domain-containing protein [Candidatus Delongbacteria bacterium]